ncbi:MAG: hypothetical protein QY321_00795 [Patescibacteria group bacterium]|nr:MAG: hypothetical protein QY321_00795 [Patescibacteria group bacterium]
MFNKQQINEAAPAETLKPLANEQIGKVEVDPETADIYYMPEDFHSIKKIAGSQSHISGALVLVGGIIFLLGFSVSLYFYFFSSGTISALFGGKENEETPLTEESLKVEPVIEENLMPGLESSESTMPSISAVSVYRSLRAELETADTVTAFMAVFNKYGSTSMLANLNTRFDQLDKSLSEDRQIEILRGNNMPKLDDNEMISEEVRDTRSIITIRKTGGGQIGTATFLPERGEWKFFEEVWSGLVVVTEPLNPGDEDPTVLTTPDDDNDGLTNLEEIALGTDPSNPDTDGDGYLDLEEINNNYNPVGPGPLIENPNLTMYLNSTFGFSFLHPLAWQRSVMSSEDSITITTPEGHFMQMIIQPNSDQLDIISWYRTTFAVNNVPTSSLVVSNTWDGVRSPTGHTVYLTGKDRNYIYTFTYNFSTNNTLSYPNIFEMMLRSLTLGI